MIQIEKILLAVDFSEHTDIVLAYATELAASFGSEVLVCHVVEKDHLLSQIPPGGEGYFPPNLHELQERHAQQECEKLLSSAKISRSRILIASGSPYVELVRIAREEGVDLLIVGTHGRGPVAHMLLGSVAERVVRKAACPVLTVRSGEHDFIMP